MRQDREVKSRQKHGPLLSMQSVSFGIGCLHGRSLTEHFATISNERAGLVNLEVISCSDQHYAVALFMLYSFTLVSSTMVAKAQSV